MKQRKKRLILVWICVSAVLLAGSLAAPGGGETETIQEAMRDAVLHESDQISLFGLRPVNPGLISSLVVTAVLLLAALCIRIFVIPGFKDVPGRFQLVLEQAVGLFDGLAGQTVPGGTGSWAPMFSPLAPISSSERCSSCSASRPSQPTAAPLRSRRRCQT